MKTLRKIFAVIVAICMIVPSQIAWAIGEPSSTHPDEIQPHDTGYYVWRYVNHWDAGTFTSNQEFDYGDSGPTTESGEAYTANVQLGLMATIDAGMHLTLDELSYNLGYSLGASIYVSGSRTTRPLNAGEAVRIKYRPQYKKIAVLQEYGYKLHSDFYREKTSISYVNIPITPQITFEYHY